MITVDPERPRKQSHDSRKRPRDFPSPKPDPKSKPTAKRRRQETPSESVGAWFSIRDILDEKTERGRTLYLIDWDGTDQNGQRYDPTWVRSHKRTEFSPWLASDSQLIGI